MTKSDWETIPIKVDKNYGKSPKEKLRLALAPVINSTPQQLMDLPYAGQASAQCAQDCNWDEDAGKEYREWSVTIEGYVTSTETVTVKARSEDEAYEKAQQKGYDYFDEYHDECYNAKETT